MGGVVGLYMVAMNLLYALAPVNMAQQTCGDNIGPVWLLAVPLLAGGVGVAGGYSGRRIRTGVATGLLACGVMLLLQVGSSVLLWALLWKALTANALHSQAQVDTLGWIQYRWSVQRPGAAPSLWTDLTNYTDDYSIGFGIVLQTMYTLVAWAVAVVIGSAIGASAARQASARQQTREAVPEPESTPSHGHSIGFTISLCVLGIMMWAGFTLLVGLWVEIMPASLPGYVGMSFVRPGFVAWLLLFLVPVVAVNVTLPPPGAHVASYPRA